MQVTGEVVVNRDVAAVFNGFADLERSGEYSAPVIERRKLTDGPIGAGTQFHAVDQWPGRKVSFTVAITRFELNRLIEAAWSEPMPGGWEARFEQTESGTRLSFRASMKPSGVMGLVSPLMKPWAARQTRKFLANFKRWSEAGAG